MGLGGITGPLVVVVDDLFGFDLFWVVDSGDCYLIVSLGRGG